MIVLNVSCLFFFQFTRSDECGRIFAYRKKGTRFARENVQAVHNSGRKTVPVWAWFSADGGGDFVRIQGRFNSEKYLDILQNVFLPSVRQRFPDGRFRFIHDNSSIHRAHIVRAWFREHPEIEVLPWPPKGADINPIENIWGDMVKDFESYRPNSSEEVFERALSIWEGYKLRATYWRKLALSIIKRLQLVIEADGFWTKY